MNILMGSHKPNTLHDSTSSIDIRHLVQLLFLSICLFLGIRFYLFVSQLASGAHVTIERPPGVEAFLPISALVSLRYFLVTGIINKIHPSGLIIFLMICATAIMFKRAFCSWICPFGLLSDYLEKLHSYIFGRSIKLPPWLDIPLRGIKYILASFFIWSVFVQMPAAGLEQFIRGPFNTFADVNMLEFFTHMSITSFLVIMALIISSTIINRFWCRYLCPYGALLGILGLLSMGKIKRNEHKCVKCGKCEKVCPGMISIMEKEKINSPECYACLKCVDICPKNALDFSIVSENLSINKKIIALVLIVFFTLGIITAELSGHWYNNVPVMAYRQYVIESRISPNIHK